MKHPTWISLGVLALVVSGLVVIRLTGPGSESVLMTTTSRISPARWVAAGPSAPEPTATLLSTDPLRRPHGISDALVDDIDAVPAGERIDVTTYWLDSRSLLEALTRAHQRGVTVTVVVADVERAHTRGAERLARLLGTDHDAGSRWAWSRGPARASWPGILHDKTWRFSRVGGERWVMATGSWNASDEEDRTNHALMLRVAGREEVYDVFAEVGRAQLAQRSRAHPLRTAEGDGWAAYFLPMRSDDPDRDPVVRRLRAIPARSSSVVRIAMYSMWGPRALVLADELARLARSGVRITLVAGPTVDPLVRGLMRDAGIRVLAGCWSDGTFTHSKDMAASYLRGGRRQWWTWVGSDNWTGRGRRSDQAVLGVRDRGVHQQFERAFTRLLNRPPGVYDGACLAED